MLYLSLKLIHILLAIAAVGANLTYAVWYYRANKYPEFAAVALRGIKLIDDRIANPAYGLLLPVGALMVWVGHLGFGTRWISWAMGLWVLLVLAGVLGFTPTLKRQIAEVDRSGAASPQSQALAGRANAWAAVLGVIVLAILVLMVFKPT